MNMETSSQWQKQLFSDVLLNSLLKNFAKFTGKHLISGTLFNKVAGLETLLKKS